MDMPSTRHTQGNTHGAAALGTNNRIHLGLCIQSCAAALTNMFASLGSTHITLKSPLNWRMSASCLDVLVRVMDDEGHGIPPEGRCPLAEDPMVVT